MLGKQKKRRKHRRRRKGANMKQFNMKNFILVNIARLLFVIWVVSGLLIGSGDKAVIATFIASSLWLSVFFTVNQF